MRLGNILDATCRKCIVAWSCIARDSGAPVGLGGRTLISGRVAVGMSCIFLGIHGKCCKLHDFVRAAVEWRVSCFRKSRDSNFGHSL